MTADASTGRMRAASAALWTGGSLLLVLAVLVGGVGMVAVLGGLAHKVTWDLWSSVGQAFGVLASVLSGLALAAVVIVFRSQRRELIQQQTELALQRIALNRSAEANVRLLHVRLVGLAISDPSLASVWPSWSSEVSPERHRQYLYANLILQQARVQRTMDDYSEEEFASNLKYLFTSPNPRILAFDRGVTQPTTGSRYGRVQFCGARRWHLPGVRGGIVKDSARQLRKWRGPGRWTTIPAEAGQKSAEMSCWACSMVSLVIATIRSFGPRDASAGKC